MDLKEYFCLNISGICSCYSDRIVCTSLPKDLPTVIEQISFKSDLILDLSQCDELLYISFYRTALINIFSKVIFPSIPKPTVINQKNTLTPGITTTSYLDLTDHVYKNELHSTFLYTSNTMEHSSNTFWDFPKLILMSFLILLVILLFLSVLYIIKLKKLLAHQRNFETSNVNTQETTV